jgi:hypothetical protein
MKYAVEMGSGAMIYIKIGSGIQKVNKGDTQTHTQHGDRISILFFQNKESGNLSLLRARNIAPTITFTFCYEARVCCVREDCKWHSVIRGAFY